MFYLFLALLALWAIYLFLGRLALYRYVGYNYSVETLTKFHRREDFVGWVILGFLFTLWAVSTADLYFHFLY